MFGKFSQLHVHYRQSSLSQEHRVGWWQSRGVIHAGDRAPDVVFTDTRSSSDTTLFRLMAPLRPVILFSGVAGSHQWCERLRLLDIDAYAVTADASTEDRLLPQLFDRTGDFARLYGFRTAFLCLIRPDGHVGLVQIPPNRDRLLNYLGLICDPAQLRSNFN